MHCKIEYTFYYVLTMKRHLFTKYGLFDVHCIHNLVQTYKKAPRCTMFCLASCSNNRRFFLQVRLKVPVTGEMVERNIAVGDVNEDVHCTAEYMDPNSFTSILCAKGDCQISNKHVILRLYIKCL